MARDLYVSRHALKVAVTLAGLYSVSHRATPSRTVSRPANLWLSTRELPLDDVQSASKGLIQVGPDIGRVFEHI